MTFIQYVLILSVKFAILRNFGNFEDFILGAFNVMYVELWYSCTPTVLG